MEVRLGKKLVGDSHPCYCIGEIGINHNGDVGIACELITQAAEAGFDAVKFQKRTVENVYTPEELARPRESVFGNTNGDLKRGLEFGPDQYGQINDWCRYQDIDWFASPWDVGSVDFLEMFDPPCYKIASASLSDLELLRCVCATGRPMLVSTGMADWRDVDAAVNLIRARGNPLVLLHCVSTYPSRDDELNLSCIPVMRERYGCLVGYSGHEHGLSTTVAAVVLGACVVERHITLDRAMWGSDQSASIEPAGFRRLIRDIRAVEMARGTGIKTMLPNEIPIAQKLRRVSA